MQQSEKQPEVGQPGRLRPRNAASLAGRTHHTLARFDPILDRGERVEVVERGAAS